MRHGQVKGHRTGSRYPLHEPEARRRPQFHEEKCLAAVGVQGIPSVVLAGEWAGWRVTRKGGEVGAADAAPGSMDSRVGARE